MSWRGRKSLTAAVLALALLATSVPAGAAGWALAARPVAGWEQLWIQALAWMGLGAEKIGAVWDKTSTGVDPTGNGQSAPTDSSSIDPNGQPSTAATGSDYSSSIDPNGNH